MKILVTGVAGFIGFHVARALLARGADVVGIDNINDYYDVSLKMARLGELDRAALASPGTYEFLRGDLAECDVVEGSFARHDFDRVIHLAAQAGVRYSIENPLAYVSSNLVAFTNILEACRHHETAHLIYASTSSVYGANGVLPFSENHSVDHPLQFYAATKRANELMAHSYSHLFNLPTTGLRFFTVYGPWGRPDMALFTFTRQMLAGEPIELFNNGNHTRDFTYIDDIVEGVVRVSDRVATANPAWDAMRPDPASASVPYVIYNIGNSAPVELQVYVEALEEALGCKARVRTLPMQRGDMADTYADVSRLVEAIDYRPATKVRDGVRAFVDWYRRYYAK